MKGLGLALGFALTLLSASAIWAQSDVISEINVQGNRRIPAETVKARIFTHPGTFMIPPPWSVISTRCGTPGISRISALAGNRLQKDGG